jgi:hypothetical protein
MGRRRRRGRTRSCRFNRSATVLIAGQAAGGVPAREILHEHRGAPRRVRASGREEERRQLVGDAMRTVMRHVTPLGEPARAVNRVACEPLVARLPTHVVPGTKLRHRVEPALMIGHELQPLIHRRPRRPGHRSPRERAAPTASGHVSCADQRRWGRHRHGESSRHDGRRGGWRADTQRSLRRRSTNQDRHGAMAGGPRRVRRVASVLRTAVWCIWQ